MKRHQRIISGLLALCMVFSMFPVQVFAEETATEPMAAPDVAVETTVANEPEGAVANDNDIMTISTEDNICGDNLTWSYDESTRTLTISGTGAMYDYPDGAPWDNIRYIYDIVFEMGITSIGAYAFKNSNISRVDDLVIPEGVVSIGAGAFQDGSISAVVFPESLEYIGEQAFHEETYAGLSSVVIPAAVAYIGDCALYSGAMASVVVAENNATYTSQDGVLFNKDMTELIYYPPMKQDEEYTIPNGVTAIADYAFLTTEGIFVGMDKQPEKITVPGSVTSIGVGAFRGSRPVKQIWFEGDAPATIASDAFTYVTAAAFYPDGNATWTESVMQNYGGTMTWLSDSHEHNYSYSETVKAPTCEKQGYTTHTCICYDSYVDNYVDALGHAYGEGEVTREPSCEKEGIRRFTCANNNIHYCTEAIPATGHSGGTATCAAAAVCSVCSKSYGEKDYTNHTGETEIRNAKETTEFEDGYTGDTHCVSCGEILKKGEVIPATHVHNYEKAVTAPTCTEKGFTTYTCTCDDSYVDNYVDATGHTGGTATCTAAAVCSVCSKSYGDKDSTNHIGETEIRNAKEATEFEDGYTGDTHCVGCGELLEKGKIIPSTHEHSYKENVTKPTCTEQGFTTYECSCGDNYVDNYVDATGHTGGTATCASAAICSVCGEPYGDKDNNNHIGEIEIRNAKGAKEFEDGYTGDTHCVGCGELLEKGEVIPATHKHSYKETVTKPTCTEKGFTTYTCTCDLSYVDDYVDATGHIMGEWCIEDEAKCEVVGLERRYCEKCSHSETREIQATGHSFGAWYESKASTYDAEGEVRRDCKYCDQYETRKINRLPEGMVANGICGDNLTWVLDEDGVLTVSGIGKMYDYDNIDVAPWFDEEVTCVIIHSGVTSIGSYAFDYCYMTNIELPDSIEHIGRYAFSDCDDLTEISLPEKLTKIEEGTFAYSGLNSISIPDTVTEIGKYAFDGCVSLSKIVLPNGITKIEESTFDSCSSLRSVTIPNTVTEIGFSAFAFCDSLTGITIPDSVTFIDNFAFESCTNLYRIEIPGSVTKMGTSVFSDCENLKTVVIQNGLTRIEDETFAYSGLNSISIPDSVTEIGQFAFSYCDSLYNITLPSSINTIESSAFEECTGLEKISIPAGVSVIEDCVFSGCAKLSSVTIPSTVTTIEDDAFYKCSNLRSITIPQSVSAIGAYAFSESGLTEITVPDSVTSIGSSAFGICKNLTDIKLPDTLTYLEDGMFEDCSKLKNVKLPNGLESIGVGAFWNCTSLSNISIPDSVTTIYDNAFYGCSSLESIRIPADVTDIDFNTFERCTSLSYVVIPASVTWIGTEAFLNCTNLTDVYYADSESAWTQIEIDKDGNEYLLNATIHYNSTGPDDGSGDVNDNATVRFLRKWDAEKQTAYWGVEPPIVEGLDLGSQVTEETDTSFLANVDELVGTYVLVETKARDDGMIDADTLISIKPLETKNGTITAMDATTITIDGVEYIIPESVNVYELAVGDSVMYHLYNGVLVGINGEGSAQPGQGDSDDVSTSDSVRYFTDWDEENKTVNFGREVQSMVSVTDTTDTSFLNDLDSLLGKYVLVEVNEQDGIDELVSIKALKSVFGSVSIVHPNAVVIDDVTYNVSDESILSGVSVSDYILCHIYEDVVIGIEILQSQTGELMGWNKETLDLSIDVDDEPDMGSYGYALSDLANEETLKLLNRLSSGNTTIVTEISFVRDEQGLIYLVYELCPVIDGEFTYLSSTNAIFKYKFHYDESWFQNSSYTYQHDLTKMSLRVAMAAGDMRCISGMENMNGYEYLRNLMTDLGFDFSKTHSRYILSDTTERYDNIGYGIGSKTIIDENGEKCTLIMVGVRGSGYGAEWGGNFRIGTGMIEHDGFRRAADQVIDALENYIAENEAIFHSRIKVWISGYSRAGATTNLVGAYLDDGNVKQVKPEDVYAFCFECPQNTTSVWAIDHVYSNIVNIINPIDLVPKVAMSSWGFKRFGTDYILPSNEASPFYLIQQYKMKDEYQKILEYSNSMVDSIVKVNQYVTESIGQASIYDEFTDDLAYATTNRTIYTNEYQSSIMPLFAQLMGKANVNMNYGDAFLECISLIPGLLRINTAFFAQSFIANKLNYAHYMELCLSWLESLDGLYQNQYDTYRKVFVNCPVDVNVCNSTGKLVAQITNNVVQEIDGGVVARIDDDGQKIICLPTSEEYSIQLTATDDGYMTYTVTEYSLDTAETERLVSYYEVELTKGDSLQGIVEDLDEVSKAKYPLTLSDGQEATATIDQSGTEVKTFTVDVMTENGGTVNGGGNYLNGEYAKVSATANIDFAFIGWFVGDELVSTDAEYRFAVTADTTIAAKFEAVGHVTHVSGTEWFSDSSNHWHKCTGCDEKLDLAAHSGGTATCASPAICSECGETYGDKDSTNHTGETEIRNAKAAEEFAEGYTGDTHCVGCGELLEKGKVIPATHKHNYKETTTKPTCTEPGSTVRTCSCGDTLTETLLPTGHDYDDGKVTTKPGCETEGVKTFYCKNDKSHTYTEAVAATGHDYDEGKVTAEPGCETEGSKIFTCKNDKTHTYTEKIEATGHSYDEGTVTTEPGCETEGVKTFICQTDASHVHTESIPAIGHAYDEGVVTTEPGCETEGIKTFTCKNDVSHIRTEPVAATGHSYEMVVTAPTCTEKGYTTYTCACGDTYTSDEVAAVGHNYVKDICTVCGKFQRPSWSQMWDWLFGRWWEDACQHSYTSVVTEPTCMRMGYTTNTCSECGHCYVDSFTKILAHTWDDGEVTREATCTEDGEMTYTCDTCGMQKPEIISAPGHQYGNGVCEECGQWDPTTPTVPAKPITPSKPNWGNIWIWICGWWKK